MSRETKFNCDQCQKPVTELYGPLRLQFHAPNVTMMVHEADFCSIDCAINWMKTKLPQKLS